MKPSVAAILAGGLGTRLRSVVGDCPKPLAAVGGRPFLTYLLDQVAAAGLRRVVLLTGYRGEQIRTELGDSYRELQLDYSQESESRGTAGALRLGFAKLFPDSSCHVFQGDENVLVMNGDSYCPFELPRFCQFHAEHAAEGSLVLAQIDDASRFGQVEVRLENRIARFREKDSSQGRGWVNAGIYLLNKRLIEEIPEGREVSLEREMFPAWSQRGILCGFYEGGSLLDIGTPESYRSAGLFLSGLTTDCTVPEAKASNG